MLGPFLPQNFQKRKSAKCETKQAKEWLHCNTTCMLNIHLLLAWTCNNPHVKHVHVDQQLWRPWLTDAWYAEATQATTQWPSFHHSVKQVFHTCAGCARLHMHNKTQGPNCHKFPGRRLLTSCWQKNCEDDPWHLLNIDHLLSTINHHVSRITLSSTWTTSCWHQRSKI